MHDLINQEMKKMFLVLLGLVLSEFLSQSQNPQKYLKKIEDLVFQ